MELLKERIQKDGKIKEGNVLKVDSFLNHQMDTGLFREIGKEFKRRFDGEKITKILTIEASGIGIACIAGEEFQVPVVFAKKTQTKNIAGEVYTSRVESYTHGKVYDILVSKEFIGKEDRVLLIDDFLANGKALEGLIEIVEKAGAHLAGAGIVIEKGFQPGGEEFTWSPWRLSKVWMKRRERSDSGKMLNDMKNQRNKQPFRLRMGRWKGCFIFHWQRPNWDHSRRGGII